MLDNLRAGHKVIGSLQHRAVRSVKRVEVRHLHAGLLEHDRQRGPRSTAVVQSGHSRLEMHQQRLRQAVEKTAVPRVAGMIFVKVIDLFLRRGVKMARRIREDKFAFGAPKVGSPWLRPEGCRWITAEQAEGHRGDSSLLHEGKAPSGLERRAQLVTLGNLSC